MYSGDAPGEAMRLLEEEGDGGLHAYFSGAFGNVTAGKYSSTTDLEGNLLAFGRRLADGILHNLRSLVWEADPQLGWAAAQFPFPRIEIDHDQYLAAIRNPKTPDGERQVRLAILSSAVYGNERYPLHLLRVGANRTLWLPGEPFVEYQLYLQSLVPDQFLAVAGNCNDAFYYLPLAEHLAQGGYEVTSFRWCTSEFESRFKETAAALIRAH
jgi:hypothetical protein